MASEDWESVEIEDVTAERETQPGASNAGALLCKIDNRTYWIPKSLIHEDSEVYKTGTSGTLVIPRKIAVEKGLV